MTFVVIFVRRVRHTKSKLVVKRILISDCYFKKCINFSLFGCEDKGMSFSVQGFLQKIMEFGGL